MNVFYTNDCPIQSANEHCRVHRNKMILEYTQLLSSALRLLDGVKCKVWVKTLRRVELECGTVIKRVKCKQVDWYELPSDQFETRFGRRWLIGKKIYSHTHVNHPSAVWVRKSSQHYAWVWRCAMRLCDLYSSYSDREHKTQAVLEMLCVTPDNIPDNDFTRPPVAAPDEFKAIAIFGDVCKAYQEYLCSKFAEWLSRETRLMPVEFDTVPTWYTAQ